MDDGYPRCRVCDTTKCGTWYCRACYYDHEEVFDEAFDALVEACKAAAKALASVKRNKSVVCDALQAAGIPCGPSMFDGWERNLTKAEAALGKADALKQTPAG